MKQVEFWWVSMIIAYIALTSCTRNSRDIVSKKPDSEAGLTYNKDLFGHDINLVIINHGDRPICFPRTAIAPTSPNFILRQNGVVVPPQREENRESVAINGVDVAEGLAVVPAGKKRNFYINIGDFALDVSKFTASIQLDVLDCAEVFSARQPLRQTLQASAVGSLPVH